MFGQLVIGPPGSGKTTYCLSMQDYLLRAGRRTAIVNLDPANETVERGDDRFAVNILDLVSVSDVMEKLQLGPNGALIYAMEYLCKNLDWLDQELEKFKGFYLLFDFPGQVELYSHLTLVTSICEHLKQQVNIQLTCIHLIDSFVMCDASRFISGLLLSLTGMLMVGLPHLNVLTKVDLIKQYGDTILPLEFFTSIPETGPILACLLDQNVDNSNQGTSHNTHQSSSSQTNISSSELSSSIMNKKKLSPYASLNARVAEMAVDYALVGFKLMSVKDEVSVVAVAAAADKANGFIFTNDGALQNRQIGSIPGVTKELDESDWIAHIEEKFVDGDEEQ